MKSHHRITSNESDIDTTLNLSSLVKLRVISSRGMVVGRVSQIRIHPTKMLIEGVVVSRGMFRKPLYIGSSYIDRLSDKSFILKIEPSVLLKGRRVLDSNGKTIGRVKDIERKEHSNDINELVVRNFLGRRFSVKVSDVKSFGEAVILKTGYDVSKKSIKKKS